MLVNQANRYFIHRFYPLTSGRGDKKWHGYQFRSTKPMNDGRITSPWERKHGRYETMSDKSSYLTDCRQVILRTASRHLQKPKKRKTENRKKKKEKTKFDTTMKHAPNTDIRRFNQVVRVAPYCYTVTDRTKVRLGSALGSVHRSMPNVAKIG